jgi:hypothetical protein
MEARKRQLNGVCNFDDAAVKPQNACTDFGSQDLSAPPSLIKGQANEGLRIKHLADLWDEHAVL